MYARVNTFQGSPENVDEALKTTREKVIPAVRKIPGNAGIIQLVDRATGTAIGITLWKTEADLRSSEQAAGGIREQSADANDSRVVSVERFEVTDLVLEGQSAAV